MREVRIRISRWIPRLTGALVLILLVCAAVPPARYGRDGIRPPVPLPEGEAAGDGTTVWRSRIPRDGPGSGGTLAAYVVHQWAELWLDGELVYRSEPPDGWRLTRSPGRYWILVPIGPEAREARLVLRPVYEGMELRPVRPLWTDYLSLLAESVSKDAPELVLSSLCVLVGGGFTVFALLLRAGRRDRERMACLGASTAACGIWRLTSTPALSLLFSDRIHPALPGLLTEAGLVALYLLPPLFLGFLTAQEGPCPAWTVLRWAERGGCLILFSLQILGVRDLWQSRGIVWMETVLTMVPLTVSVLRGLGGRTDRSPLRTAFYLAFSAAVAMETVLFCLGIGPLRMDLILVVCAAHILIVGVRAVLDAVEREERILIARAYAVRARMELLLSQIRPHFVYNTLTSVYYLCDEDPEKAKEVLSDFTEYLQMDFEALAGEDLIAFGEELRHARAYLAVERARYGDGLRVEWDIGCTDFLVPALTLQPLVENAVKHGIGVTRRPETITVRTRCASDRVDLTVEDDGPGFDPASLGRTGIGGVGLRNVRERLGTLCHADVRIESAPGRGTRVTVRLPSERGGPPDGDLDRAAWSDVR